MTILNTITKSVFYPLSIVPPIFIVTSAIFLIVSYFVKSKKISLILIGASILLAICSQQIKQVDKPNQEVYYEVIFDETAKLNDVINKYEVVSRNGDIFTVKEKTK